MARILLVDDETTLLGLLKRYLERHGYQVDIAESADAALALFRASPGEFGIVVTDLTLDGTTGDELIGQMREFNSSLPALIASGYPHEPQLKNVGFLQKPFLPQMLVDAIEKALKQS
jgi:DNA-binding NtrC family response regulator